MAIVLQRAPGGSATLSADGLTYSAPGGWATVGVFASVPLPSTGKIYYEVDVTSASGSSFFIGVAIAGLTVSSSGSVTNGTHIYPSVSINGTLGVRIDTVAKSIALYINNVYYTTVTYTFTGDVYPWIVSYGALPESFTFNFGKSAFKYNIPTGHVSFDEAPACLVKSAAGRYLSFNGTTLVDVGITEDYSLGFNSFLLPSVPQSAWDSVPGSELLIRGVSDTTKATATTYPYTVGTLATSVPTSVDLKGYAGINKITVNGTGGKYAISLDKGATWNIPNPAINPNLISLIHFNSNLNDEIGNTWLASGGATSSVGGPFGNGCGYIPAGAKLTLNSATAFNFQYDDFTIDWWEYDTADRSSLTMKFNSVGTTSLLLYNASYDSVFRMGTGLTPADEYSACSVYAWANNRPGAWHHKAIVVKDRVLKTYINGTQNSNIALTSYVGPATKIEIGAEAPIYIDEFRVTKGVALWSAPFTPPTAPPSHLIYNGSWKPVAPADIPTLGMTQARLNSFTAVDYASIFQRTQLDIYAALTPSDSISSIDIELPANLGPAISGFKASTSTTHKTDIVLTANIVDLEGEDIQYRLKIDGVVYQDWTSLMPGPVSMNVTVPYAAFTTATTYTSHQVDLEARDTRGATTTAIPVIIGRVNTLPTFTVLTVNSRIVRATIGDADNDKVKYRILVNDIETVPWSEYQTAPYSMEYYVDRSMLIWSPYPASNKITVEYKDDLDQGGTQDMFFLASYIGLIFTDEVGNLLNDDKGTILKRPDLGISTAGTHGLITKLKLKNLTGTPVRNVRIAVDPASVPSKTHIKLSSTDTIFEDLDVLANASLLNDGDEMTFYTQPSSEIDASSSGVIKLVATAQLV